MLGAATNEEHAYRGMAAYLRSLPEGARSFPECEAAASLLLGLRARGALDDLLLPPPLREQLERAGDDGWLPEVTHVAVLLAVRDARFGGPAGDDALIEWMQGLSRPLVVPEGEAARAPDPAAAVRLAAGVWGRFHRGTTLEVGRLTPRSASMIHRHPDEIFPPVVIEWRRRVLLAMLAGAGAAAPTARATHAPGLGTTLEVSW